MTHAATADQVLQLARRSVIRTIRQPANVVRALDERDIAVEHLQLHAPSLDDVFLAKTGRSLEGAQEEAEAEVEE